MSCAGRAVRCSHDHSPGDESERERIRKAGGEVVQVKVSAPHCASLRLAVPHCALLRLAVPHYASLRLAVP